MKVLRSLSLSLLAVLLLQAAPSTYAEEKVLTPLEEGFYAAIHEAALANDPAPLLRYVFALPPAPDEGPDYFQQGGTLWVSILTLVNDRWMIPYGRLPYDLSYFDNTGLAPDTINSWHKYIEAHGNAALRSHAPKPNATHRWLDRSHTSGRTPDYLHGLVLSCSACYDGECDSLQIANFVQEQLASNPILRPKFRDMWTAWGPEYDTGIGFELDAMLAEERRRRHEIFVIPVYEPRRETIDIPILGTSNVRSEMRGFTITVQDRSGANRNFFKFLHENQDPYLYDDGYNFPSCHPLHAPSGCTSCTGGNRGGPCGHGTIRIR